VRHSGDVFGIYTPAAWPTLDALSADEKGYINVPDPSGRSFLFSLVNAAHTPYRVPILADASGAFGVHSKLGIFLGNDHIGTPAVVWLMYENRDALASNGNSASTNAHRAKNGVDSKIRLPIGVDFIAGRDYFGAEMIEVYHIE
jgi:hypothetical protein